MELFSSVVSQVGAGYLLFLSFFLSGIGNVLFFVVGHRVTGSAISLLVRQCLNIGIIINSREINPKCLAFNYHRLVVGYVRKAISFQVMNHFTWIDVG